MSASVFGTRTAGTTATRSKLGVLEVVHAVLTMLALAWFFASLAIPAFRLWQTAVFRRDFYADPLVVTIFWLVLFAFGWNRLTVWWATIENSWVMAAVVAIALIGGAVSLLWPVIVRIGEYVVGNTPPATIPLFLGGLLVAAVAWFIWTSRKK